MEDIPDSDDTEPRKINRALSNSLSPKVANALIIPGSLSSPDIIVVTLLLLLALICSSLRASLSASAALETPWDRKNIRKIPDRQGRFTLLIIQYFCMILAWLITADVLIHATTDTRTALYTFSGITALWLVFDAILRWVGGKYSLSITERVLPAVNLLLEALQPVGAFFLNMGIAMGVSQKRETDQVDPEAERDEDLIEEKELVLGVAAMGKTTAREAMVSKSNIRAFNINLDFHELMDLVNKYGYSRIPVYRHNLDNIEGILYIKDLLPYIQQDEKFVWQKLIRKPYLIPETKRLDSLLDEFQERRVHMAIVIDEYGSTRGLITLEDIIEEIFGDINDEHDDENDSNFVQLDSKNYIFEGQALLNDVIRSLNLEPDFFADLRSESETLAGLLIELFTRFPRNGEEVTYRDLTFRIHSANQKQIKKIRVILK